MSHYNKEKRRTIFNLLSKEPFKISRSKIDLFIECPRCFYLDQRLGVPRPKMPGFTLNVAVDHLLKKEFDIHRAAGTKHPLSDKYGIDAVPFKHEKIEEWRDALKRGISYLHPKTNLLIRGGIDDIWITPKEELIIVDYKATSKEGEIELEDTRWHNQYRRQLEVYQWLFRQNGFKVYDIAYFVYVNGKKDRKAFDGKLEFDVKLIPHQGSDKWVEKALFDIKETLMSEKLPGAALECDYCNYRIKINTAMKTRLGTVAETKESVAGEPSLF